MNTIERIRKRYERTLGYLPSDHELVSWYTNGEIVLLSDTEENDMRDLMDALYSK